MLDNLTRLKPHSVGVIVMNHNRLDMIQRCIISIRKNTIMDFDLVVVDWKSTDGSRKWLKEQSKEANFTYIEDNSEMGYAECNWHYIRKFQQWKYFFLVNNDMEVAPGWLEFAVNAIEEMPYIGVVAPMVIRGPHWTQVMSHGANLDINCNTKIPMMNFAPGKNWRLNQQGLFYAYAGFQLYRMDLYNAIGELEWPPGAAIYFDDTDYGMKINSAGFQVRYIPQSKIMHHMHMDNNRAHHVKSLQLGRTWFQDRWWKFVKKNGGYDPMRIKELPVRNDGFSYCDEDDVQDIKGFGEDPRFK